MEKAIVGLGLQLKWFKELSLSNATDANLHSNSYYDLFKILFKLCNYWSWCLLLDYDYLQKICLCPQPTTTIYGQCHPTSKILILKLIGKIFVAVIAQTYGNWLWIITWTIRIGARLSDSAAGGWLLEKYSVVWQGFTMFVLIKGINDIIKR